MHAKISRLNIHIQQMPIFDVPAGALVYATDPMLTIYPSHALLFDDQARHYIQQIGWSDVGTAVTIPVTNAQYQFVIAVVPPKWGEGSERGKLANAMWEVLSIAESHRVRTLALPPVGIGVSGYPLENCAKTMLEQMIDFAFEPIKSLRQITLCAEDELTHSVFVQEFRCQLEALPQKAREVVSVS